MTDEALQISAEAVSPELVAFYRAMELDRAASGEEALRWTFESSDEPFCVMRRGDRIVGLSAYIQRRVKLGNAIGSTYQAVDSFVDESMRGKGVFTRLARFYSDYAQSSGIDAIWGFPNENAAHAWFQKLDWTNHGKVPFLIRPLRAGYFLRRLRLPGDFPLSFARNREIEALAQAEPWMDDLWEAYSASIGCSVIRDQAFIDHRLFSGPPSGSYRVVGRGGKNAALVATREAEKHGGHIAYLMEAMGSDGLEHIVNSELARLRERGSELVLAWSFPWSPNYRALRKCGFLPFPQALRPVDIWFGAKSYSAAGEHACRREQWYLSYLDSDTV